MRSSFTIDLQNFVRQYKRQLEKHTKCRPKGDLIINNVKSRKAVVVTHLHVLAALPNVLIHVKLHSHTKRIQWGSVTW